MKKLLITSTLILAMSVNLAGCTAIDTIKDKFTKNISEDLTLETDVYLNTVDIGVSRFGYIEDSQDDDLLDRLRASAIARVGQTDTNYTNTVVPSEIISDLKETGDLNYMIAVFFKNDVKDIHYASIPNNVTDNPTEYFKYHADDTLINIPLANMQAEGTYVLLPVHIGVNSPSTALYWTDSNNEIQSVCLSFKVEDVEGKYAYKQ